MTDQNTRPQPSAEPVDDLIERLRDAEMAHGGAAFRYGCVDCGLSANLCIEAIARIAALEAQLADAKTALTATGEAAATHLKRAMALEAENARLMGLVKEAGEVLRVARACAYSVSEEINPRGYNWSEAYLDQVLPIIDATLAKIKEATDA